MLTGRRGCMTVASSQAFLLEGGRGPSLVAAEHGAGSGFPWSSSALWRGTGSGTCACTARPGAARAGEAGGPALLAGARAGKSDDEAPDGRPLVPRTGRRRQCLEAAEASEADLAQVASIEQSVQRPQAFATMASTACAVCQALPSVFPWSAALLHNYSKWPSSTVEAPWPGPESNRQHLLAGLPLGASSRTHRRR